MNKSHFSSKYLKAFDPFLQQPPVDSSKPSSSSSQQQSCLYLKNVETVRETQTHVIEPSSNKQNTYRRSESSQLSSKQSKRSTLSKNYNERVCESQERVMLSNQNDYLVDKERFMQDKQVEVRSLKERIRVMQGQLKQKDEKLVVLIEHLETLQFQREIINRNYNKTLNSKQQELNSILSKSLKKELTNKKQEQGYLFFISHLNSNLSDNEFVLQQIFSKLKQQFRVNKSSAQLTAEFENLTNKHTNTLKLNSKLFEQSHQLRQQLQRVEVEHTLHINSITNVLYQTVSLLKSVRQDQDPYDEGEKEYIRVLQRIVELHRTIQSLTKNIKEFKQNVAKRGLDKQNQEWYLKQLQFKQSLIKQQKQQLTKLNHTLSDICCSIEANLALKHTNPTTPTQQNPHLATYKEKRASPLATFKSSINICSKKGSMNVTRGGEDIHMLKTSRNRMFDQVVNTTKSEREMQGQKSLKQLKTKLEVSAARYRKSTMWG